MIYIWTLRLYRLIEIDAGKAEGMVCFLTHCWQRWPLSRPSCPAFSLLCIVVSEDAAVAGMRIMRILDAKRNAEAYTQSHLRPTRRFCLFKYTPEMSTSGTIHLCRSKSRTAAKRLFAHAHRTNCMHSLVSLQRSTGSPFVGARLEYVREVLELHQH